jgi:hypothetical protein
VQQWLDRQECLAYQMLIANGVGSEGILARFTRHLKPFAFTPSGVKGSG